MVDKRKETSAFKRTAIEITVKSMSEPPNKWKTFNDRLNTTVFYDNDIPLKNTIKLEETELPIMECILPDSFVIVTTHKIVSKIGTNLYEMPLTEVEKLGNTYEKRNFKLVEGKYPKTHLIEVLGEREQNLLFEIDSYYPAYFARILILNLSKYLKKGKWYLNPNKDYRQTLKRWKK